MAKSQQQFTAYLDTDEHIEWVTEENVTVDVDRNVKAFIILIVSVMVLVTLLVLTTGFLYKLSLFMLAVIAAVAIYARRLSLPMKSPEQYALTNKRILKRKDDHISAIALHNIDSVHCHNRNKYIRIECVPHDGKRLILDDLDTQQAQTILNFLAENTSVDTPSSL